MTHAQLKAAYEMKTIWFKWTYMDERKGREFIAYNRDSTQSPVAIEHYKVLDTERIDGTP